MVMMFPPDIAVATGQVIHCPAQAIGQHMWLNRNGVVGLARNGI
jgi:hypothetical protein